MIYDVARIFVFVGALGLALCALDWAFDRALGSTVGDAGQGRTAGMGRGNGAGARADAGGKEGGVPLELPVPGRHRSRRRRRPGRNGWFGWAAAAMCMVVAVASARGDFTAAGVLGILGWGVLSIVLHDLDEWGGRR